MEKMSNTKCRNKMNFRHDVCVVIFTILAGFIIITSPNGVHAEQAEIELIFPSGQTIDSAQDKNLEIKVKITNYTKEDGKYYLKIFSAESELLVKKEIKLTVSSINIAEGVTSHNITTNETGRMILGIYSTYGPSMTIPIDVINTGQNNNSEYKRKESLTTRVSTEKNVIGDWFSKIGKSEKNTESSSETSTERNTISDWFSKIDISKKDNSKTKDEEKEDEKKIIVKKTEIKITFPNGNNISKEKESHGITSRIDITVSNYNPSHGYYYMKVTDPKGKVINDSEIFLSNASQIWFSKLGITLTNQNPNGEYTVTIYTEKGQKTSAKFTVSGL